MGEQADTYPTALGEPRRSWQMRKRQERAANKEGLAEWQVLQSHLLPAVACRRGCRRAVRAITQTPSFANCDGPLEGLLPNLH